MRAGPPQKRGENIATECYECMYVCMYGMEWNGMEWNGMEWYGMVWYVCMYMNIRIKIGGSRLKSSG